jgi:transposase/DNA-binding XRE family transcriptional regulator
MVVVGVDAHKATHTLVAVDSVGVKVGELTVRATNDGHLQALGWVRMTFGADVVWAVEDSRSVTSRLERDLLDAGQRVVRVPPHMMARVRASGRARGKSDPIDALAAARAVLREPDLPVASHDGVTREFKLLVDRRDDLVTQRTAVINRLLWRVHELDPSHSPAPGSLDRYKAQRALRSWLGDQPGLVAELARDELAAVADLTEDIKVLDKRIAARVQELNPLLLNIFGCGRLTAAKVIGEAAVISRFRSEAAFASYAGVAPIPHWSGPNQARVKPTRSGNRQLNGALYRIALSQIRSKGPAHLYYQKRRGVGDSHLEAMRRIERRIARKVFGYLRIDQINWAQAEFPHNQSDPAQSGTVALCSDERQGSRAVDGVAIDDPDLRQIGARLRALRNDAGRTQQQTAVAVGLSRTSIVDIEAGRKNITLHTLYALAEHFGADPAELLRPGAGSPSC